MLCDPKSRNFKLRLFRICTNVSSFACRGRIVCPSFPALLWLIVRMDDYLGQTRQSREIWPVHTRASLTLEIAAKAAGRLAHFAFEKDNQVLGMLKAGEFGN